MEKRKITVTGYTRAQLVGGPAHDDEITDDVPLLEDGLPTPKIEVAEIDYRTETVKSHLYRRVANPEVGDPPWLYLYAGESRLLYDNAEHGTTD